MNEPIITVNGIKLTEGQAMTVRVALMIYGLELQGNGLGEDETGKAICEGYLRCIKEIHGMF